MWESVKLISHMLHGLEQQNYVTGIREMLTFTSMWAFGYGAREVTSDRRSGNFPFKSINDKSLYQQHLKWVCQTSLGKAQWAEGTWAIMQWFQLQYTVFLTTDSDLSSNTACAHAPYTLMKEPMWLNITALETLPGTPSAQLLRLNRNNFKVQGDTGFRQQELTQRISFYFSSPLCRPQWHI